jgi:hypothetical protein
MGLQKKKKKSDKKASLFSPYEMRSAIHDIFQNGSHQSVNIVGRGMNDNVWCRESGYDFEKRGWSGCSLFC